MGIKLSANFDMQAVNLPLDPRFVVDDLIALNAMDLNSRYIGLKCFVKSEGAYYYIKDDLNVWLPAQVGGSGDSDLYTDTRPTETTLGFLSTGYVPTTGIPSSKLLSIILHDSMIKPPIISNSTYNGQVDVPTNLAYITFDIPNGVVLKVEDASLITSVPSGAIKNVQIVGKKIYVYLNPLDTGTDYKFTVEANSISNNGDNNLVFGTALNTSNIVCSFQTEWLPYPSSPIILTSSEDGTIDQPITLNKITFPIDNFLNLTLGNTSAVTSSPTNIISSISLNGNTLEVYLHNMANLTQYTINVGVGTVLNNGDGVTTARSKGNENVVSMTFKTIAPNVTPPIIGQSSMNGLTEQNIYTTEITFLVTNAISLSLVDGTKVTANSSTGSSISIGNATLDTSTNILHIPILTSKLDYSASYSFTVQTGIVMNTGDGIHQLNTATNTNSVTATFSTTTKPKPQVPLINQSSINNTTVVSVHLSEITFTVSNDFNLSMADTTKVTCNKLGVIGTPTLDLSTKIIHVPIISTLDYYTNYIITAQPSIVHNEGDNIDTFGFSPNTNSVSCSFWTEPTTVTKPIIQQSSINSLTGQSRTMSEIAFPISNFIGTTILDASKITCDHSGIIGTPVISESILKIPIITTLDYLTTYSITIGVNSIQNSGNGISALGTNPNDNIVTCSFTTIDCPIVSAPTVLQSTLNNAINQATSLAEITFNVSNSIGLIMKNPLAVSSNPVGIIGSAYLDSSNIIHVPLQNLNSGTNYSVSILAGIVANIGDNITTSGSTTNSNSVTATFKTIAGLVSSPVVQNSTLNGTTNKEVTLSEIIFPVSNCIGTTLKDGSKVSISPSGTVSVATFDGSNIHVPLSGLTYNTNYSVTVMDSIVTNHGDGINSSGTADNTNTVTCTFGTRPKLSAPTLTAPSTTSYPANTTQIKYIINQSGCTLIDASKISVTGCNIGTVSISSTQLIINVGGMVVGSTVVIHILDGAIANTDGVGNVALGDYTFSVTAVLNSLPPHDFELDINWATGLSYINLTTITGYSPENPLSIANYTAQKIQVYYLGVKADLDAGLPEKCDKILCKDFETGTANSMIGMWYITSTNVLRFTKAPTTNIKVKLIRLT